MGNASSADTNDGMRLRLHSLVNQAPGLTPADVDKIYRCFRKYCVQGTCSVSNERTKNRRRIHHSLASELNSLSDTHTLTYLRRPFGRPNTIVNNDRGWLFLERITIAIKAAAAEKAQFDEIVVSNCEKLRLQIYKWSERLRDAASKQTSEPRALRDLLNHFDGVLESKRFSFSSDEDVVRGLMKKLVNQFANDWKGESMKQKSMSKRAREILLRWGCFSEQYVERAGFLKNDDSSVFMNMTWVRLFFIGVVAPLVSVLPFSFQVTSDPMEDVILTSLFFGAVTSPISTSLFSPFRNEFAGIPYGRHNIVDVFVLIADHFSVSCRENH